MTVQEWKESELNKTYEEIKAKMDRLDLLEKLIGTLPEGAHHDEWLPRTGTWLKERENWQTEVNQLREKIKEQDLIIYGLEEGAEEWKQKALNAASDIFELRQRILELEAKQQEG